MMHFFSCIDVIARADANGTIVHKHAIDLGLVINLKDMKRRSGPRSSQERRVSANLLVTRLKLFRLRVLPEARGRRGRTQPDRIRRVTGTLPATQKG